MGGVGVEGKIRDHKDNSSNITDHKENNVKITDHNEEMKVDSA